jgi:CAI-1 autoinducer synthase
MNYNTLPEFIEARMRGYQKRFVEQWKGKHLLKSSAPTANDVSLCSNDYLDLLQDPSLYVEPRRGTHLLMSSVFLGEDSLQAEVERAFSGFFNVENSILCPSGWMANAGLIQTIANKRTPVYIDQLAHMSFHDGARLAGATAYMFAHGDAASAGAKIAAHGPGVIVVDSVYSTDGSLCPLSDFAVLSEQTGCVLVVDEAHAAGTHGPQGRGRVNELKLVDKVDFMTVSLAKAFAGRAGLITCTTAFKDYFLVESHPSIFSSALMEHDLQWFMKAIPAIRNADDKRKRLHANAHYLRTHLHDLGFKVSSGTEQIIAVQVGSEHHVQLLQTKLQQRGIFGSVFCYPATAKNKALVRLSVHSDLPESDLANVVLAFKVALRELRQMGIDGFCRADFIPEASTPPV